MSAIACCDSAKYFETLTRGGRFLGNATQNGHSFPVSPIGFYFAKLWYHEKLYPLVWTVDALEHVTAATATVASLEKDRK